MPSLPVSVRPQGLRRFLLATQGLPVDAADEAAGPATPARVLRIIRRLECVQLDPVAAVERNQHLVLAARLPGYAPAVLERLLVQRRIFEYWANAACVLPMEDYPILEATRRRLQKEAAPHLAPLQRVVDHVLARLEAEGPLPSRAFTSEHRVHGWWDNQHPKTKATSHALSLLWDAGRVMVVRREGTERYFDLPHKVVPTDLLRQAEEIGDDQADRALLDKYLRAFRVFDLGDSRFGWRRIPAAERREIVQRLVETGAVVPLAVDGVRREYFILAEDLGRLRTMDRAARREGRTAAPEGPIRFLPPLDNLLWRRERVADLFGFDYTWEVYVPAAKRRYGYYAMPILAGDRLIGRMDPRLDRANGRLIVRLLHLEPGVRPTRQLRESLRLALEAVARFHQAGEVVVGRTDPRGMIL